MGAGVSTLIMEKAKERSSRATPNVSLADRGNRYYSKVHLFCHAVAASGGVGGVGGAVSGHAPLRTGPHAVVAVVFW